jgi:hypothetical protein
VRKKNKGQRNVLAVTVAELNFVNEHLEKPQVQRVNGILELLAGIRDIGNVKHSNPLWLKRAEMFARLGKAFRRYRWTLEPVYHGDGWHERKASAQRLRSDDDRWEHGAIFILLGLAQHHPDWLSKIKRCSVCRNWMLARKSDHRFCSRKCRQYEYDNDPEVRERKLSNMRRLYRVDKERTEKAKRGVGFSGKATTKTARK